MVINRAISPLGLSWLQDILYARLLGDWLGIQDFTPAGGLMFAAGCRFYMNVSNVMWLGMSPKQMARGVVTTDALLAEIMANIDPRRYRAAVRPAWVRARLLLFLPRVVWAIRGFFWNTFWNLIAPERGSRRYRRKVEAFEAEMAGDVDGTIPLTEFARTHTQTFIEDIVNVTLPALIAGLASPGFLISRRSQEASALAVKFRRGFTGNLVVEQGIALFRLAKLLGLSDSGDIAGIVERLQRREMPGAFMNEWNSFVGRFGCRGPHEMDVASPRYAGDPTLALEQISSMVVDDSFDPERAHRRHVKERRRAYEDLLPRLGWLRRALLRRIYRLTEAFGGSRDTPKYHAVLVTYAIRKRALIEGRRLVSEGRLDAAEDVFDLRFADLEAAARDRALDLRGTARERKRFSNLAAHVTEFPQLIDSRGRILRPAPRGGKPGELAGIAVSPGSVIGPVKVLRNPREKPVAKGDVLVAYATDPGWTPLFVNAAAVVLEVGGVLQHGAVIAREYGKPCVVGVDRVVSRLRDGQTVEVDGTAGVIRLVGED
jgi:pyruvate,water dikinase